MPRNNAEISTIGKELSCRAAACKENAISLSRFCWKHTDDKQQYTNDLKGFFENGGVRRKVYFTNLPHALWESYAVTAKNQTE